MGFECSDLLEHQDAGRGRFSRLFRLLGKADERLNVVVEPRRSDKGAHSLPEFEKPFGDHASEDLVGSGAADLKALGNLSLREEAVSFMELAGVEEPAQNLVHLLIQGLAHKPFCIGGRHG